MLLGLAVDWLIPHLPAGLEQSLGALYAKQFVAYEQPPAGEYLQELLDNLANTLLEHSAGQYVVHLVPSNQANALALPGGHIVVFSALLEEMDSENELAFILAHELGHFAHRDHLRGLGRRLAMMAVSSLLFGVDDRITNLLMGSVMAVEMKFSRSQETQADLFALDLVNAYYGHIAGATNFFQKTAEESTQRRLTYYFSTHPYPADRVAKLQQQIQAKGFEVRQTTPLDPRIHEVPQANDDDPASLKDIL